MKKLLPIAAIGAGVFLVIRYLQGRKTAMENLKITPISIAIDSARSTFTQLFYRVRLNMINNEAAPIIVRQIDLDVFFRGDQIAKITKDDDFTINPRSQQIVEVIASISTIDIATSIIDLIKNRNAGPSLSFNIRGFVVTDLGRIPVNFTKTVGNA